MMRSFLLVLTCCIISFSVFSQTYTVNGNASQQSCRCYVLTQAVNDQHGSVWNNYEIDLNASFTFNFDVNLSSVPNDGGADGIAFVLQPISTSVGGSGNGLGFGGISPSIGVTLDTYQNSDPDNDPAADHIAIQRNGILNHADAVNNLAGPIPISSTSDDVEDGLTHQLKIQWDATTHTLSTYFDGVARVSVINDFVNTTFGGNSMVYWGFTGSTGGLNNFQKFCTALSPGWSFTATQKRCVNEPVTFNNTTIAFTTPQKTYWTFGDDPTYIDSVNLSPTHIYTTAGDFVVTQRVKGFDGCEEINTQMVRIGSKPVAGFFKNPDSCIGITTNFTDTSRATVGTINTWFWDLDNAGATSTLQNPSTLYTTYGTKTIKLWVKSLEGCESDTLYQPITIRARPIADFTFTDSVCLGSPTIFTDHSTLPDGLVNGWIWLMDNVNITANTATVNNTFATPGLHTATLFTTGTGNADCLSPMITKNLFVTDKPHAGIKQLTACQTQNVILQDSSYSTDGVLITGWWWDLGNSTTSTSQNPAVTYNSAAPVIIKHVVYNSKGCISDTLTFTLDVHEKPVAGFTISDALCNNSSISFADITGTPGGIGGWAWTTTTSIFSTQQNASNTFIPGPHTVGLAVTSNYGCKSDTTYKLFTIKTKPQVQMTLKDACKFSADPFSAIEITTIGITSWHWTFGDNTTGAGNPTTHTYNVNGAYPVTLVATSTEGCNSDVITGTVNIYGTNAFAGNDTIAAAGQPVQLHATGGISYEWTPGAPLLSGANTANPVAVLSATQVFHLKAYTPEGCESFDDVKINIYKGPDIYLPNAFTPNGDHTNDILYGTPVGVKDFKYMRIFNRYGQLLFETTDYRRGWDGTYKGQVQEMGTYVVLASGIDYTGKLIEKKAFVILIH